VKSAQPKQPAKDSIQAELNLLRQRVVELEASQAELERVSAALRQSEARCLDLIEHAADIIYTLDNRGNFEQVNEVFLRASGYARADVIGRNFETMLHPEDKARVAEILARTLSGESVEFEFRARKKDGRYGWYQVTHRPILGAAGRPAVIHCIARDTTAHKQSQQAREERGDQYRQLLEASQAIKLIIDPATAAIVDANRAAAAFYGLSRSELLTRKITDFIPDRPEALLELLTGTQNGRPPFVQVEQKTSADQVRVVRMYVGSLETDGQRLVLAIVFDVTEHLRAEEQVSILAKFADENPNPMLRLSLDGEILYANPAASALAQVWQRDVGQMLSHTMLERERSRLARGQSGQVELAVGERVYVFMLVPVSDSDSLYVFGRDITAQKRHEEQLLLLASVFANSIQGIYITSPEGYIERVNPAFTAISGYTAKEVIGRNPRLFNSGQHDQSFYEEMWATVRTQGRWEGETWNRRKNGEAYPAWLSITAIKDHRDRITHFLAIFHDITDIKHGEEQLKHQANHDALTGLPNRQLFNDRLERALAHARRNRLKLALLFLDLDNFKSINDSLGHHMGDVFLQEVARRLKGCCRAEDTVARLGGDEFIIILPEVKNEQGTVHMAQRIIQSFLRPVHLGEQELFPSASIGITMFPADGEDVATLVKNADMAMYKAKEQGRNTHVMYTEAMNREVVRRLALETSLRRALEQEEFRVYYQPKINIQSGAISGMEALVRWQRTEQDLVLPGEFIPVAEETGLIFLLGEWVLRTACRQTRLWHDQGFADLSISVNLSAKQFQDENLGLLVKRGLKESGLSPGHLNLEITEHIVMMDTQISGRIMAELKNMGVNISIDDFGTGYSSLRYLKRFPLMELKIDKSFIRDLPDHPDDVTIVKAILSLAHSLNLRVVAEGVESVQQFRFMRSHGCDEMQGFLYSPPLAPEECTLLLKENRLLAIP
jgi:diguanylate cyclase (GGDEF)-like protein/PAS domain S-box-containing protein